MRVKKYLALIFAAILATTMLTGCPWDIEDDAASDSSSAPSSSSRPSHDSSDDDSGSAPSSPSTPDDEESEKPDLNEIFKEYGTVSDDGTTLTITNTEGLGFLDESFRPALNNAHTITKIEFGENITSIPNDAFDSCTNLTSVDLGNVTSIGGGAFFGCTSLTSVDLGSVTSIDASVFQSCTALTSVDLSNVTSIDVSAFQGCTALTSVDLGNVTSIGGGAFFGCTSLTHIRLGENMEAFNETNLTGVHPDAFYGIASEVHIYYGDNANAAKEKWEGLRLNHNGTVIYHPADDWDKRENNDNATDALPGAMKGLLALTERLG